MGVRSLECGCAQGAGERRSGRPGLCLGGGRLSSEIRAGWGPAPSVSLLGVCVNACVLVCWRAKEMLLGFGQSLARDTDPDGGMLTGGRARKSARIPRGPVLRVGSFPHPLTPLERHQPHLILIPKVSNGRERHSTVVVGCYWQGGLHHLPVRGCW